MIKLKETQTKLQIKKIRNLYKKSFPKFERKPFKVLLKLKQNNVCDILTITDDSDIFYGLVITIKYRNLVLLDYFAITPEFRNQGIGSKSLKLIQELYNQSKLIIEIEDTASNNAKNIINRIKRKDFYLKNNMNLQNFKINLFGCDMEILTFNGDVCFEEYHEIFKAYFPLKFYKKIKLI